jgi:predicted PhzF superfamily epimerase YddE/YHI9
MDFPAKAEEEADAPAELADALGLAPEYVGRNDFDYVVEAASEEAVLTLRPDYARLKRLPARGVIVTSRAHAGDFDFVSRFFAPAAGIDEDPVTGSAHCALGPFWAKRLGKADFLAYQASARGGVVKVRVEGGRVLLGGQAVTVMRGGLAV